MTNRNAGCYGPKRTVDEPGRDATRPDQEAEEGRSAQPARAFARGMRDGSPFAAAAFMLASTFGILAEAAGMDAVTAVAMSALVFGAASQFAVVGVLAHGGDAASAMFSAALLNARFLPMGLAVGPSLRGGWLSRALQGQAVVDASWAMAARADGTFETPYLFGHTAVQYPAWVLGTAVGSLLPAFDMEAAGLDAAFPAIFLSLLVGEVRTPRRVVVAVAGATIAVGASLVLPAGLPLIAAAAAALLGLVGYREESR